MDAARIILDVISYNVKIINTPDEINLGPGELDIDIETVEICKDKEGNIYLIPKIFTYKFEEDVDSGDIDKWESFLYDKEKDIIYKQVND